VRLSRKGIEGLNPFYSKDEVAERRLRQARKRARNGLSANHRCLPDVEMAQALQALQKDLIKIATETKDAKLEEAVRHFSNPEELDSASLVHCPLCQDYQDWLEKHNLSDSVEHDADDDKEADPDYAEWAIFPINHDDDDDDNPIIVVEDDAADAEGEACSAEDEVVDAIARGTLRSKRLRLAVELSESDDDDDVVFNDDDVAFMSEP
jgi:hypothetical protein